MTGTSQLFGLLTVGSIFSTVVSGCSILTLPAPIDFCWHKVSGYIPVTSEYVPNGTNCNSEKTGAQTAYLCANLEWNVVEKENNKHVTIYRRSTREVSRYSGLWAGRSGPPLDTTSPIIICTDAFGLSKPIQTHGKVSWVEPMAHDNEDGEIRPTRYGRGPDSYFTEGVTKITYEAKDRRGNTASCTTNVHLKVVRCTAPTPVPNGYFLCHPSTDFVYGGSCTFGCYDGFELEGESEKTCNEHGQWSAAQPKCQPWKCDPPPIAKGSTVSCTNGNNFRSICTYSCRTGYDMPPQVSKTIVCSISRTWRSYGTPECIDVEAPHILNCPSTVITGTDVGINTSLVIWTAPGCSDNSGEQIVPLQMKGPPLHSHQTAGTYEIIYGAKDAQGNEALSCNFNVIVIDVRCPKLYVTPYTRLECPKGYRTGAECNISCDPGKELFGNKNVECIQSPEGLYGEWNWKGGVQSHCKRTNICNQLKPPLNGAVVCDNWLQGNMCQFQCRKGTDMANIHWKQIYTCSTSGDWVPEIKVKPCNVVRRSSRSLPVVASFYFDGDCYDPITKAEIARNFISTLSSSLSYKYHTCRDSTECNPKNVQVWCGGRDRSRRDTDQNEESNLFEITADLPFSTSENDSFSDVHAGFVSLYQHFKEIMQVNASEMFGINVSVVSVQNSGISVICPEGSVKSEQSLNCVYCPMGTYFENTTKTCKLCEKGTFQNVTAQTYCNKCPFGTSTVSTGSITYDSCEDACEPGSFSITGIQPCSPCELGCYQPHYDEKSCIRCEGSKTTLKQGSKSSADCEEFDIVFSGSAKKKVTSHFEKSRNIGDFAVIFWLQYHSSNESDVLTFEFVGEGNTVIWSCSMYTGSNESYEDTRTEKDDAIPLALPDMRWHPVMVLNLKSSTDIYIGNEIVASQASAISKRHISVDSFVIRAGETFSGAISQLNIWQDKELLNTTSRCRANLIGDILSWQTIGGSVLNEAYVQIPSACDDFDNCVSSPCFHGKCHDVLDSYHCECESGYSGARCEINIDDCEQNVCMEGATCVDGIANYTCACQQDMTGMYCEIHMVHGEWSGWTAWSECSQTCGEGEQSRRRLCNNPNPDNGGNNCTGLSVDVRLCNLTVCPICPDIEQPANGTLACTSDNETIVCNISCHEGFDFDIEPLESYLCGPDTFHVWNFQTKYNPVRKLPKCSEILQAEKLLVHYSAKYRLLSCENEEIEAIIREKVNVTLETISQETSCLAQNVCTIDKVIIFGCETEQRKSRSVGKMGFSLTISIVPDKGDKSKERLLSAFINIHKAAENGRFLVNISNTEYDIDLNLTSLAGEVTCPAGNTRVNHYCVPCGVGSFLYKDYCEPCPFGRYQDETAQRSCKQCPEGKTTLGEGSTSVTECSVKSVEEPDDMNGTLIVLCVTIPIAVMVLLMPVYRKVRSRCKTLELNALSSKPKGSETSDNEYVQLQSKYTVTDSS